MDVLLGIDVGLTATKAVLFDTRGTMVRSASALTLEQVPRPHHVERDGEAFWSSLAATLREVTQDRDHHILAIGVSAHGDGLWLVDADGMPVRPGILSLDTRARLDAQQLSAGPAGDALLDLTGQQPWPASPATLLHWLSREEPTALERARWMLSTKDLVRHRLTGTIGTDLTEASVSFTDMRTQDYTAEAFNLYGLGDLAGLAPPIALPTDVVGTVTEAAAAATGLPAGTPVVAGLHDVDAGAIGAGAIQPGQLTVIAGSFSINEVISDKPRADNRWCARSFVTPGRWMSMALSPASSTNLEWFVRKLCRRDVEAAKSQGIDPYWFVDEEVGAVAPDDSRVTVLPYLYGSPQPEDASAAYVGLRAWHSRGHLLRGVYEGIAFNHRQHVDALADGFPIDEIRLIGGVTRSRIWPQILADTLNRSIVVPTVAECGALGTAMCAAVGAGVHPDLTAAGDAMGGATRVVHPVADQAARLDQAYTDYQELVTALRPWWRSREQRDSAEVPDGD